ncbi:hypothetical protein [Roseovarius aestuarii]|nr:hypothetical protein [Roseovarius aestuarii]
MRLGNMLTVVCMVFGFAGAAYAQERDGVWVTYYLKDDTSTVTGLMQVALKENGQTIPAHYSLKRVSKFIAEDCASGKIGKIELGKQKYKRRWGFVRQEFTTTCQGGPNAKIGATSGRVQVQVKRQADGRDVAEYFFGRNGDMVTVNKVR